MINLSLHKHYRRKHQPKRPNFINWLKYSLLFEYKQVYINFFIVDAIMSQQLNLEYRQKNYPTNVITLEYNNTRDEFSILNGEVILCDEIIVIEAQQQKKSIYNHYAHLVVHSMLHLQGMDHINNKQAQQMEGLEIKILQQLGIANPY
ncbi:MAG: rRNA maturation RNase YbeY [Pseudomonadota bacterium]|jgi:probable rRNA maturation factor